MATQEACHVGSPLGVCASIVDEILCDTDVALTRLKGHANDRAVGKRAKKCLNQRGRRSRVVRQGRHTPDELEQRGGVMIHELKISLGVSNIDAEELKTAGTVVKAEIFVVVEMKADEFPGSRVECGRSVPGRPDHDVERSNRLDFKPR